MSYSASKIFPDSPGYNRSIIAKDEAAQEEHFLPRGLIDEPSCPDSGPVLNPTPQHAFCSPARSPSPDLAAQSTFSQSETTSSIDLVAQLTFSDPARIACPDSTPPVAPSGVPISVAKVLMGKRDKKEIMNYQMFVTHGRRRSPRANERPPSPLKFLVPEEGVKSHENRAPDNSGPTGATEKFSPFQIWP
jgi:hypothetical protein